MEITPSSLPWQSFYKLMIGSIVPRPIGWISTIDEAGRPNLAPFSFFNAVCPEPPTVLFCPNIRGTDGKEKDTLQNVRATGEFVVNIVTEDLVQAMNITSTEFPAHIDEFEAAGLTPIPAFTVRPPRVAESPVHFECRVVEVVDIGAEPGGGSIVIGRVLHVQVSDEVLFGNDKVDILRLKPVGRLAGAAYCRVNDLFDVPRPPSEVTPLNRTSDRAAVT